MCIRDRGRAARLYTCRRAKKICAARSHMDTTESEHLPKMAAMPRPLCQSRLQFFGITDFRGVNRRDGREKARHFPKKSAKGNARGPSADPHRNQGRVYVRSEESDLALDLVTSRGTFRASVMHSIWTRALRHATPRGPLYIMRQPVTYTSKW